MFRRFWPLLVRALLSLPPLVYFVLGSTPGAAPVQEILNNRWVFSAVVVMLVLGVTWIGWQVTAAVRTYRQTTAWRAIRLKPPHPS